MAEAEELEAIETERARQRQEMGNNQYRVVQTFAQATKGKTRDKVAESIGFGSGWNYDKAKAVWEAAGVITAKSQTERKLERLIPYRNIGVTGVFLGITYK